MQEAEVSLRVAMYYIKQGLTDKNVFVAIDGAQIFSVGLAFILLIVNAMQYMNAAPEGKADIKKKMVLYGIGAVIVFSALELASIVFKFFDKNIQAT